MTSNLFVLPLLMVAMTVRTNEDWDDGIAFELDDTDGTPIDLAGISFEMKMRHLVENATSQFDLTNTTDGGLVVDDNILKLDVSADEMSRIAPNDYVFDIVGRADGHQRVIVTGVVTVIEGVTR